MADHPNVYVYHRQDLSRLTDDPEKQPEKGGEDIILTFATGMKKQYSKSSPSENMKLETGAESRIILILLFDLVGFGFYGVILPCYYHFSPLPRIKMLLKILHMYFVATRVSFPSTGNITFNFIAKVFLLNVLLYKLVSGLEYCASLYFGKTSQIQFAFRQNCLVSHKLQRKMK